MKDDPFAFFQRIIAWSRLRKHPHPLFWGDEWRIDDHGNLVRWSDYGKRDSGYGWELDHWPTPKSLGGTDSPDNIRALHWRANATHGGLLGLAMSKTRKPALGGLFGLYSNS